MKMFKRLSAVFLILILCLPVFAGGSKESTEKPPVQTQWVDYVSQLKLDMSSSTLKTEATVRNFVDGDTTHFLVPESVVPSGVIKARYLAINTPECTGKIEEYGKKASNFTKEKLSNAVSIIIESDDEKLNLDSTGSRHLVWIWYKETENSEYRNLNLEILQNGLAIASSSANNRYGSYCTGAIAQARAEKLNVYSGEKDPDFFYGDAVELTLKELRSNIKQYEGVKVAFEGVVTSYYNNGIFVEDYDSELDMYFGMYVYIGYGLSGLAQTIIDVGNRARIVGTVSYYETGGTWQVSGLSYKASDPDNPSNLKLISKGNQTAFFKIEPDTFVNGKVQIESDEVLNEFDYPEMAMGSSIEIDNLDVVSVYTTDDQDSSSNGAMTLYCTKDGIEVQVRTIPFVQKDRSLVTSDAYMGKNISVKGFVDFYNGSYQVKVLSADKIIINN